MLKHIIAVLLLTFTAPVMAAQQTPAADGTQAAKIKSLEETIADKLRGRDVAAAVQGIAALALLKADNRASSFKVLREEQVKWNVRGARTGEALDLEVAAALSDLVLKQAETADERGMALNDLANTMLIKGERGVDRQAIDAAIRTYREALKLRSRERVPAEWASTQEGVANAFLVLGKQKYGVVWLREAVTICRSLSEVQSHEKNPEDWARTKNNLGITLKNVSQSVPDTKAFEDAIVEFKDALTVRTRFRFPVEWAMTQSNLGNALRSLGAREKSSLRLNEAVLVFTASLRVWTRDRYPYDRATTQINLGNAYYSLGKLEFGTDRFVEAVSAYQFALQILGRENAPLLWAQTTENTAVVSMELYERTKQLSHLASIREKFAQSREVYELLQATSFLETNDDNTRRLDDILSKVKRSTPE
jgi:tetratricopeptide (TPR) repeat protein